MSFAALSYYYRHVRRDPRALAEMMKAAWRASGERSLSRLDPGLLAHVNPKVGGAATYRCSEFALPGLAEQIEPDLTYRRFMRGR